MEKLKRRLPLLALGVVLAFVAVELFARLRLGRDFVFGAFVGPPQAICGEYDPDLGWRNRAGTCVDVADVDSVYRVSLNARGQRGPERDYAKPPGVQRIVLLGDSTAWGWGVGDEAMWPRLVERELGSGFELVNLAVPGYGTDQELWSFEREGVKYAPDLVLLAFVFNDTQSNEIALMQGMAKPYYARAADGVWTLRNHPAPLPKAESELEARYLRRTLSMYLAGFKLFEPPPPRPSRIALEDPKVQAVIERYWNTLGDPTSVTTMLLGRLRESASAAHADLLAFVLPHLVDRYLYDPSTPIPPHESGLAFETYGTRKLAEAGANLGFATFSVDQALLEVVEQGVDLDCGDEHLDERGNEVLARVIAARLRAWAAAQPR